MYDPLPLPRSLKRFYDGLIQAASAGSDQQRADAAAREYFDAHIDEAVAIAVGRASIAERDRLLQWCNSLTGSNCWWLTHELGRRVRQQIAAQPTLFDR